MDTYATWIGNKVCENENLSNVNRNNLSNIRNIYMAQLLQNFSLSVQCGVLVLIFEKGRSMFIHLKLE